jgi:transposase
MERIPNAVYTKEFREEAVMMVTEGGLTVPEVARRLSIPKSTISYWVWAKRRGTLSSVGGQQSI